jgi:GNAT superfamily N-acetyltransferase
MEHSGLATVTLADGSRLAIRPIEPADRDLVAAGFERLSPESRYRRFFSPLPGLSGRQLDYLTRVDHHDHEALVALDADTGDGVAVARFVRVGDGVAEPAIAVIDDWQGRGVAAALLDRLVERAREEGIDRFAALVMADNPRAVRVLERLGETRREQDGPEVELEIDLAEPEGATASVRGLLGTIAEGAVQPALTLWHRVAPRRGARSRVLENVVVAEATAAGEKGEAVRQGAEIARTSGAALHLVAARPLLLDDPAGIEERLQATADVLAARGAPVEAHLHRTEAATALLDVAVEKHARLIVVEDIPRDDPGEHLVGPAWRHVAHHAPCDVLIARRPRTG